RASCGCTARIVTAAAAASATAIHVPNLRSLRLTIHPDRVDDGFPVVADLPGDLEAALHAVPVQIPERPGHEGGSPLFLPALELEGVGVRHVPGEPQPSPGGVLPRPRRIDDALPLR